MFYTGPYNVMFIASYYFGNIRSVIIFLYALQISTLLKSQMIKHSFLTESTVRGPLKYYDCSRALWIAPFMAVFCFAVVNRAMPAACLTAKWFWKRLPDALTLGSALSWLEDTSRSVSLDLSVFLWTSKTPLPFVLVFNVIIHSTQLDIYAQSHWLSNTRNTLN